MKGGQKCRKVKRLSNVRSSLHVIIKKKKSSFLEMYLK